MAVLAGFQFSSQAEEEEDAEALRVIKVLARASIRGRCLPPQISCWILPETKLWWSSRCIPLASIVCGHSDVREQDPNDSMSYDARKLITFEVLRAASGTIWVKARLQVHASEKVGTVHGRLLATDSSLTTLKYRSLCHGLNNICLKNSLLVSPFEGGQGWVS